MTTGRCSPGGHAICRPRCLPPTGRGLRPPPGQPTKTDVALRPSGVGWRRRGEVIDADPQANASAHLGIVDSQPFTLNDVLTVNPVTRQVAPGMLADAVVHAGEGTVPAGYCPPADATFGEAKLGGHHIDAVPARRRVTRLGREKLIPKDCAGASPAHVSTRGSVSLPLATHSGHLYAHSTWMPPFVAPGSRR